MRHSIRNYFCAALIAGFIPSFAPLAYADKATDIQMLPPLSFDYKSICGGTSGAPQLLAWDGTNPINCIPGVTGDKTGLLTAPTINNTNLTSTAINSGTIANSGKITSTSVIANSLFLPNSFANNYVDVTGTIVDLSIMAGCTNGAALTKNTNGTFGCINVADIPNVGTTFVQQCSTPGTMLYFDNTKGFSCQPIPYPAIPPFPPTCTGASALQYNAATNSYICAADPTPTMPPVCPDGLGGVALQYNGSSYSCVPPSVLGVPPASGAGCDLSAIVFYTAYAPVQLIPNGVTQPVLQSDGCTTTVYQCQSGAWVAVFNTGGGCGGGGGGGMEGGGSTGGY